MSGSGLTVGPSSDEPMRAMLASLDAAKALLPDDISPEQMASLGTSARSGDPQQLGELLTRMVYAIGKLKAEVATLKTQTSRGTVL